VQFGWDGVEMEVGGREEKKNSNRKSVFPSWMFVSMPSDTW
jgi:hypothetical protein